MKNEDNLHSGHRKRMYDKILSNADNLLDHELLEVLLFSIIPRRDTNALAHKILRTFGSLDKLFTASTAEIMSVAGVGEKTAAYLTVIGRIYRIAYQKANVLPSGSMFSFANNRSDIIKDFAGLYQEKFMLYLLDDQFHKITEIYFQSENMDEVDGNISEIANAFAINKPKYAIMAHNHPSGSLLPSKSDDEATARMNLLCAVHGVDLINHVIVAKKNAVSYFLLGKLSSIKNICNLDSVIHKVKEI